jgi:hypothetical protein
MHDENFIFENFGMLQMRCVRRGRLGEGEVPVVTDGGEFEQNRSQVRRSPTRKFGGLERNLWERRKGAREESEGVLQGVVAWGGG